MHDLLLFPYQSVHLYICFQCPSPFLQQPGSNRNEFIKYSYLSTVHLSIFTLNFSPGAPSNEIMLDEAYPKLTHPTITSWIQ